MICIVLDSIFFSLAVFPVKHTVYNIPDSQWGFQSVTLKRFVYNHHFYNYIQYEFF